MTGFGGSWDKGTWTLQGQLPTIKPKAEAVKAVLAADRSHRRGPEPQVVTKKVHLPRVSSVQYALAKYPEYVTATRVGSSEGPETHNLATYWHD